MQPSAKLLVDHGADQGRAEEIVNRVGKILAHDQGPSAWMRIATQVLHPTDALPLHHLLFDIVYADWDVALGPPPAWIPDEQTIQRSNLTALMQEVGVGDYQQLHRWSVEEKGQFWGRMVQKLDLVMEQEPTMVLDPGSGSEHAHWLVGARYNITDSCFGAVADSTAIIQGGQSGPLRLVSVAELEIMTNCVANGLAELGLGRDDTVAICMPMTAESVAIYLGLIRAGCVAVSIADSFAPDQIAKRIAITDAKAIFTQDCIFRGGKVLPLYDKVVTAQSPRAVVLAAAECLNVDLREGDLLWEDFLSAKTTFSSVMGNPAAHTNILFSSGTTGDPKAIPWTQLTPIKCAADGFLHQDVHAGDVLAWPTNLGWMMGPWLIYASLINRATISLYDAAPTTRGFGTFVQDAGVTMLGVVPSLVRAWRETDCMRGLDWSAIRLFSSTGECSNQDEMLFLMALAGYRPVIEYCGGTEIGGGYITGTVVQPASPATFSTAALGLDVVILDEQGRATDDGELFVVGSSIGLSTELLNRDHHEVYFAGVPAGLQGELLRRHGDQMQRLGGGYFRAQGRVDDTMNLGGIKVSSAEIESVVNQVQGIRESAAVSVSPPGGGIAQLVVFVVAEAGHVLVAEHLCHEIQQLIKSKLNPLFRVSDVCLVDQLPRTASNKVMRRKLRSDYAGER